MMLTMPIANAIAKYEETRNSKMAAIHAAAEEMIRRALVTTVPGDCSVSEGVFNGKISFYADQKQVENRCGHEYHKQDSIC